ncbi:MAG: DUF1648 domain-containing protein [Bernardetiaceae bacterium]
METKTTTPNPPSWHEQNALSLFFLVLPFLALPFLADALPDRVPMHWNAYGEADRFGSKWMSLLFLPILNVWLFFLMSVLPKLDPNQPPSNARLLPVINAGIILFMFGLWAVVILQSMGYAFNATKVVLLGVVLLLMFLGNYMHKLQPNSFVGLKIATDDKQTWRKANRMLGYLWTGGGLLALPMVWWLSPPLDVAFFLGYAIMGCAVPFLVTKGRLA